MKNDRFRCPSGDLQTLRFVTREALLMALESGELAHRLESTQGAEEIHGFPMIFIRCSSIFVGFSSIFHGFSMVSSLIRWFSEACGRSMLASHTWRPIYGSFLSE